MSEGKKPSMKENEAENEIAREARSLTELKRAGQRGRGQDQAT